MSRVTIHLIDGPYNGEELNADYSVYAVPDEIYVATSEQVDPGAVLYTDQYPKSGDAIYIRQNKAKGNNTVQENIKYQFSGRVSR